jgi:predicted nucleic acid-binding protein
LAIYAAVLDACVLVPISLADILLRVAEKQLFRPVWSQRILEETRAAIEIVHPDIDMALIDRRIWHMNETFPGALMGSLDTIEAGLALPDPNDNHVLAAALRGHCQAIVTANLDDFPADYLDGMDIEAISPDDFLLNQLDLVTRAVLDSVWEQAQATMNPSLDIEEMLVSIARAGAPNFADEVLKRV